MLAIGIGALAADFFDPLAAQKQIVSGDFVPACRQVLRQRPTQIAVNPGDKNLHLIQSLRNEADPRIRATISKNPASAQRSRRNG